MLELLKSSQYFTYDIDGLSNDALKYAGDHLDLDGVTLRTPHPIDLETQFSVKVLGVGKNHFVGKMREYIAYEDLNDINTPSDIKRVVEDFDAHCLIIEFDDANFAKAEDIAKVRYSRPFTVFIPTETFVESEWADVTIKVKPEDMEALDEQLAKTKQLYSKIYCTEADEIRRHIEEQIPTDCQWDCIYSYGDGTLKIILYMSEYERTSEPRWGE